MSTNTNASNRHLWLLPAPFLILGLWGQWQDFFQLWHESIIYNHGFLVLAGTLFLLYRRREQLKQLVISGSPVALLLLAGSSLAFLLLQAADVRSLRLALVPFMIVFWGWSIWGAAFLKAAAGPTLLLLFAVPIWDDFSPVLQHITVFFNDIFLQLAGIEATINEFLITLEVGAFMVEGGCSGVRYLMVAVFLATFYGQMYYQSHRATLLLVILSGLLSMLANWVRVFGIIVAGHYTNMETSLVEDHELFGWVIFVIFSLIPLYFIAPRFEGIAPAKNSTPTNQAPATAAHTSAFWAVAASLLLVWPAVVPHALKARTDRIAETWAPSLMERIPGWSGPLRHANVWHPEYANPDIDLSGVYVSENLEQVQLQIIGYRNQTQDKELIFYGNTLFDAKSWGLASTAERLLTGNDASGMAMPTQVNETVLKATQDGSVVIIWSWYDVGGYLTASKFEAKLIGAFKKLTGDNRGALWALAGRCSAAGPTDCDQQRRAFEQFMEQALQ